MATPWRAARSRKHEFEADAFAAEQTSAGDLVAVELGAVLRGEVRDAEARERVSRQVHAPVGEVFVDVAQDVRALHGVAERPRARPRLLVPDAEDRGHQLADAAGDEIRVFLELGVGAQRRALCVECLAVDDLRPGALGEVGRRERHVAEPHHRDDAGAGRGIRSYCLP